MGSVKHGSRGQFALDFPALIFGKTCPLCLARVLLKIFIFVNLLPYCHKPPKNLCTKHLTYCGSNEKYGSKRPKGEPNPYGKYFIGQSYLADVGGGVINVTFEPRCRNNWHIHHKAVQVLICVSGRGWYQEWGKDAVEMPPGIVIAIPAEVKHWHGAAKDSWFQHLTYHRDAQEGASNEWLELWKNRNVRG